MKVLNSLAVKAIVTLLCIAPLSYGQAAQNLEPQQNQAEQYQQDHHNRMNDQENQAAANHEGSGYTQAYQPMYDRPVDNAYRVYDNGNRQIDNGYGYNGQSYPASTSYPSDCCDPCDSGCCGRSWWGTAAVAGVAAVIGGVIGASINDERGHHGEEGKRGRRGRPGRPAVDTFTFDKGQSLTFNFVVDLEVTSAISSGCDTSSFGAPLFLINPLAFVATPDGTVKSTQLGIGTGIQSGASITIDDPAFGHYTVGVKFPTASHGFDFAVIPTVDATRNGGSSTNLLPLCSANNACFNSGTTCISSGQPQLQVEEEFVYGPIPTQVPTP